MGKKLHEIAADLGMRSDQLKKMLAEQGYAYDSAMSEVSTEAEALVRGATSGRKSMWERVTSPLRRRHETALANMVGDSSTSLAEDDRQQGQAAVSKEAMPEAESFEAGEEMPLESFEPEGTSQDTEEVPEEKVPAEDWPRDEIEEEQPESEIPVPEKSEEVSEKEPEVQPEKEEIKEIDKQEIPEPQPEKAEESEFSVEDLLEEQSTESEPEATTAPAEPEPEKVEPPAPSAKAQETEELESFSADDLLEQQIEGDFETTATSGGTPEEKADQGPGEQPEEVTIDELLGSQPEEAPAETAAEEPPVEAAEAGEEESGDSEDEAVTIDELLGSMDSEEEKPVEAVEEPEEPVEKAAEEEAPGAETKTAAVPDDLLDTESLLGLEDAEQEVQKEKEAPDAELAMEDLLGESSSSEEQPAEEPEPSEAGGRLEWLRMPEWMSRVVPAVLTFMKNPAGNLKTFFAGLNNLELVAVCSMFLLLLSGGLYGFYIWYNFARDGQDERFFEAGELLRKAGRHPDAVEMYNLVLRYHPDSELIVPTYFGLAQSNYDMERYRNAIALYDKALSLHAKGQGKVQDDPDFPDFLTIPEARMNLTRALLRVGDYEAADRQLAELVQDYPGEDIGLRSRMIRGDLYARWAREEAKPERYRGAIAEYELALQEYPDNVYEVDLLKRLGETYRALYATQSEDEQEIELLQEAALDYERAIEIAESEGRKAEELARLRTGWADTVREIGMLRRAATAYESLLKTDLPMDLRVEVLEKSARTWLALEDYPRAVRRAQELIDSNPDDAGLALGYYVLGDAEWERPNSDYTRMMQDYQRALELDDNSGENGSHSQRAYMRMTNVLYMEKGDYEAAAGKYKDIIERWPDGPYTYRAKYFLAECLEKMGRYADAADAYQRCIEDFELSTYVAPRLYRDSFYRRADALYAAQSWAEAVEACKDALVELGFPKTEEAVHAREQLANSYLKLENYPRAEKILANLLENHPASNEDGKISLKLGEVRENLFDYEGARDVYMGLINRAEPEQAAKEAYLRFGETYLRQAKGTSAEEALALRVAAASAMEAMKNVYDEDIQADYMLGKIYLELEDRQRARARLERFLQRATAEDPQAEVAVLLGEMAFEAGNLEEAQRYFALVKNLRPSAEDKRWRARAQYRLAECLRARGQKEEAVEAYRRVVADFSESPWAKEAQWKLDQVDWLEETEKVGML